MKRPQSHETAVNMANENMVGGNVIVNSYVQPPPPPEPKKLELFVGGWDMNVTESDLYNYFSQFGKISKYNFLGNRNYAFLAFEDENITKQMLRINHNIRHIRFNVRTAGERQKPNFFVGRLSPTLTNGEIEQYFSKFGSCRCDRIEGKLYGFMYLNVPDHEKEGIVGKHSISGTTIDVRLKLSRQEMCEKKAQGMIPGGQGDTNNSNALFVGNVDMGMNRDDFHRYFQQFGECKTHLKMHLDGLHNRGFGFIHFENPAIREQFLKNNPTSFIIRASEGKKTRKERIALKNKNSLQNQMANMSSLTNSVIPFLTGQIFEQNGQQYMQTHVLIPQQQPMIPDVLYQNENIQPFPLFTNQYMMPVENQFLAYPPMTTADAYTTLGAADQSLTLQPQSLGYAQNQQIISLQNSHQKIQLKKEMGVENDVKSPESPPAQRETLQCITRKALQSITLSTNNRNNRNSSRYSPY